MTTRTDNIEEDFNNLVPIQYGLLRTIIQELSPTDLRVFLYLYSKFHTRRTTGMIISINTIAADSGLKRNAVIRGLNSLDAQGLLIRKKRQSAREGNLPSHLTIPILRNL